MLLTQAIALSLLIGFAGFELTGLVAGGLVTPGYFALYFDQPMLIVQSLCVAVATMAGVRACSAVTLLYGRRRFILTVLLGFALQWSSISLFWGAALAETRIDALGFIIPGLLAHEMERQGIGKTVVLLFVVSALVRVVLRVSGLMT
ncbi:MAG: poly-gamma-glutamate biosynthesis protein PgsC [Methylobacteriaceae bacterium]|jgi:poly-gamma-glutamate biosynthesis protein PgsC/CapC|nr:poly-gamma-glutamate biosynthesis protein PgsC [Methylobacteriaceae bacterium]